MLFERIPRVMSIRMFLEYDELTEFDIGDYCAQGGTLIFILRCVCWLFLLLIDTIPELASSEHGFHQERPI